MAPSRVGPRDAGPGNPDDLGEQRDCPTDTPSCNCDRGEGGSRPVNGTSRKDDGGVLAVLGSGSHRGLSGPNPRESISGPP